MNVLVSIFSEKESHAVYLLKLNNISRLDVMEGIATRAPESIEETPRIESDSKKPKNHHLKNTPLTYVKRPRLARLTRF